MISKTAIHAIKALAALAALPPGAYAGAASVAKTTGARPNYLGKLLQLLSHEGLVVSQKGLGGGFRLARDPGAIHLVEAVNPIEHLAEKTGCLLGRPSCSDANPCRLHCRWAVVKQAYLDFLSQTTIADVAGSMESIKELEVDSAA